MKLSNAQASIELLHEFERCFNRVGRPGKDWQRRLKLQLGTNKDTDWMVGQLTSYYQGLDEDIESLFDLSAWRVALGKLVTAVTSTGAKAQEPMTLFFGDLSNPKNVFKMQG